MPQLLRLWSMRLDRGVRGWPLCGAPMPRREPAHAWHRRTRTRPIARDRLRRSRRTARRAAQRKDQCSPGGTFGVQIFDEKPSLGTGGFGAGRGHLSMESWPIYPPIFWRCPARPRPSPRRTREAGPPPVEPLCQRLPPCLTPPTCPRRVVSQLLRSGSGLACVHPWRATSRGSEEGCPS
jgi:hypothetical protein